MSSTDIRSLERDALEYLRGQLGSRAPDYLALEGEFAESPLEGEGRVFVFSFHLPPGPGFESGDCAAAYDPRHFVAIGETTPNYFPSYGLSIDEAYSFHVGTRFMLEMELQRVDDSLEPPGARDVLARVLAEFAPRAARAPAQLAALFKCDAEYYAVYRLTIDEQEYFALGADCPPGFYKLTAFPPQTTLRLHLGKLIRAENRAAQG